MALSGLFRFVVFPALVAGLLVSTQLKGQQNDAGLWASVSFEAKVAKRLSAKISEEFRFYENISELGTSFTEACLEYKINKYLQVSANYRFTQRKRLDDYYSFRHRIYVDVKYSKKLKPFELSWRGRFQDQYSDIGRASDGGVAEYYFRNKFSLKWDLDKAYSPYLSFELFSPLDYPRYSVFDNLRATAGIEYSISKHQKIDLYYMIQKEINVSRPDTYFILGIGYFYKL